MFFKCFFMREEQHLYLKVIERRMKIVRMLKNQAKDRLCNYCRANPISLLNQPWKRNWGIGWSSACARQNSNLRDPGICHVQRSEVASPLSALQRQNSIKVLAHGPKEIPFSRISRSLSGGTTAYVGPGATRATVLRQHGGEEPVLFVGYWKARPRPIDTLPRWT